MTRRILNWVRYWGGSLAVHSIVLVALALWQLDVETRARTVAILSDMIETKELEEFYEDITKDKPIDLETPVSIISGQDGGAEGIGRSAPSLESPIAAVAASSKAMMAIGDRKLNRPLAGAAGALGLGAGIKGLKGISDLGSGDGGAMDRITQEILRQLEKNKVIVAWIFDSSGSMADRREAIAQRFERIYHELDHFKVNESGALVTAVVSLGQDTRFMIDKPTGDAKEITDAIRKIKDDRTGTENTFAAIRETALKYRSYQTGGRRTLMIVVVTDEIGDDPRLADETVALLRRNQVPLYVMGSMATFSHTIVLDWWVDKETGYGFSIPINRGPYTRQQEILLVPFNDPSYYSGFGPFSLTQGTRETGGIYFFYDDERVKGSKYDMETLIPYKANYGPAPDYTAEVNASPLRKAVMETITDAPSGGWIYGWVHAKRLEGDLNDRQREAAQYLAFAERALTRLEAAEASYSSENSLRWRANFDLNYARLLQARLRVEECNWACADFRKNPRTLKDPKANNGWHYRLVETIHLGNKPGEVRESKKSEAEKKPEAKPAEKQAETNVTRSDPKAHERALAMLEKAMMLYDRLIKDHPNTPWAVAAAAEKSRAVGIEWQEGRDAVFFETDEERQKYNEAAKRVPKR